MTKERKRPEKRSWRSHQTKLMRRLINATPEEFRDQDTRAAQAGLSWSSWARKRLAD